MCPGKVSNSSCTCGYVIGYVCKWICKYKLTLGDTLFTVSPASLLMYFLLSELVFCLCDIPLFSSDTLTLRKDHHQKLLRIWDFVVYFPSGGFIFLLPVWNGIYCVRGIDFASLCDFVICIGIVPTEWYCFSILLQWRYIKKNNWKKLDFNERKTWTSTSDEFRES